MDLMVFSEISESLIDSLLRNVKDNVTRKEIYLDFINILEEYNWKQHEEIMGIDRSFDDAVKESHPEWFAEDNNPEIEDTD